MPFSCATPCSRRDSANFSLPPPPRFDITAKQHSDGIPTQKCQIITNVSDMHVAEAQTIIFANRELNSELSAIATPEKTFNVVGTRPSIMLN
jgi:hypothetical protein